MIGWENVYNVVVAVMPLYVALFLGYASVKWWRIFTAEQYDAVNRFVTYFTLPLFTFEFTVHVDPFAMNGKFAAADAVSKAIIVAVLAAWARCSSSGNLGRFITAFSLSTLNNGLVIGVPLVKAMYGLAAVDLIVQSSVIQSVVWVTLLLFVLELWQTKNDLNSVAAVVDGAGGEDLEGNGKKAAEPASLWRVMSVVCFKVATNPNTYGCVGGILWAFVSNRYSRTKPNFLNQS